MQTAFVVISDKNHEKPEPGDQLTISRDNIKVNNSQVQPTAWFCSEVLLSGSTLVVPVVLVEAVMVV